MNNRSNRVVNALAILISPGIGIKRWILLSAIALGLIFLGTGFLAEIALGNNLIHYARLLTLGYVFDSATGTLSILRGGLFLLFGALIFGIAAVKLYSAITRFKPTTSPIGFFDEVYVQRYLILGPKIVAIGGGTGLSNLLRGLKNYTTNLTAVVSVGDDGGSSGRLRDELNIPPPGDIRNCMIALADSEAIMQSLMDYRFPGTGDLKGHSFGNLLIAAMADLSGSFEKGIQQAGQFLAIRGRVLPASLERVTLAVETVSTKKVIGESKIGELREPIKRMYILNEVKAFQDSINAISNADLIIIGPGSLFTSIVASLLIPGINEAISKSSALKLYVSNLAMQPGETTSFSLDDHIQIIYDYMKPAVPDLVLANNYIPDKLDPTTAKLLIKPFSENKGTVPIVFEPLLNADDPLSHDPRKLAKITMESIYESRRNTKSHIPKYSQPEIYQ